jgi:hypothetical protein
MHDLATPQDAPVHADDRARGMSVTDLSEPRPASAWVSKRDYARHRGISLRTLDRLLSNGQIPHCKTGVAKSCRVTINTVDADRALARHVRGALS